MATDVRRRFPDLIQKIVRAAPHYDFFQLVRILESVWGAYGRGKSQLDGKVRFRPGKEISFPGADVRRAGREEGGRLGVSLGFMGLYGVDAAVPHYFITTAMQSDEPGEATRAFLDTFNHRFYVLLYQAWKKYHLPAAMDDRASKLYLYVSALAGHDGNLPTQALRFSGLYGRRFRSATGLTGLLQDQVQAPVELKEFVPRWVAVRTNVAVGGSGDRAMVLGDNVLLGDQVLDVSGKVKLNIGPVAFVRAQRLLPGVEEGGAMGRLITDYLGPSLSFDITLMVEGAAGTAPPLGDEGLRLGWRTWLGEADGRPYPIHISGAEFSRPMPAPSVDSGRHAQRAAA